jgi:hypothetical protein
VAADKDFFISYTGTDQAWVERALLGSGLTGLGRAGPRSQRSATSASGKSA